MEFMTCGEREKTYEFPNQNVVFGIDFILDVILKASKVECHLDFVF